MVADHIKAPICLSERTAHSVDDFCHVFYNSYQEHASSEFGMDDVPPLENVVHTVNLSTESAMAAEFDEIISTLRLHRYEPEAFVTFSEYLSWVVLHVVFMLHLFRLQETHCPFFFQRIQDKTLNPDAYVYTSADLLGQVEAFLQGRIRSMW